MARRAPDEESDIEEKEDENLVGVGRRLRPIAAEGQEAPARKIPMVLPAFGTIQFPIPDDDPDRIAEDLKRWLGEDNVPNDLNDRRKAWIEHACQPVILLWWDFGPGDGKTKRPKSKLYYIPFNDFYNALNEEQKEKFLPRFDEWKDNAKLNYGYNLVHTDDEKKRKWPVYNSMPFGEKLLSQRTGQRIDASNTAKQFYVAGPIADTNQRGGILLKGSRLDDYEARSDVFLHVQRDDADEITHVAGIPLETIDRITGAGLDEIKADAEGDQEIAKIIYATIVKDACSQVSNGAMCSIQGRKNKTDNQRVISLRIPQKIIDEGLNLSALISLAKVNTFKNWQEGYGENNDAALAKLDQVFFTDEKLEPIVQFIQDGFDRAVNGTGQFLTDNGGWITPS